MFIPSAGPLFTGGKGVAVSLSHERDSKPRHRRRPRATTCHDVYLCPGQEVQKMTQIRPWQEIYGANIVSYRAVKSTFVTPLGHTIRDKFMVSVKKMCDLSCVMRQFLVNPDPGRLPGGQDWLCWAVNHLVHRLVCVNFTFFVDSRDVRTCVGWKLDPGWGLVRG